MELSESSTTSECNLQITEENTKCDLREKTIENFTMEAFQILIETTKTANRLPFGRNRDLYESCPTFHSILKVEEDKILSNLSKIIKCSNCKGNIEKRDDEDKFEMIVDANDFILEKVGILLDEISGVYKNSQPNLLSKKVELANASWNKISGGVISGSAHVLNFILNKTKNMEKPQLKFDDKVNNDPLVPFEPRIKYKYNLLKPLAIILQKTEEGMCHYSHPYDFELSMFKPLEEQLKFQEPKLFKPLEKTPLQIVVSREDVIQMVEDLQKYKEISVDLEYHSYRSFQGFTCLMQISTRDTDYIVDTIALRSQLQELNIVFTNPSIVKVFHGADLDILWLQKDLSLYVVNMFDTHQAVKLLSFPNLSLAYLLLYYCNVVAQKHFQLADWRIRPLPQELLTYAREDTHYLLYIYDRLRNTLIEKGNGQTNLLESVLYESARICLKTYKKSVFDRDGHIDLYHRSKKLFDNRQKFALQRLFEWRDETARELDESLAYVLPNHMMLNISEILPREAQGILACCNPVPLPVRQNLLLLHQIILKAREEPLIKPVLEEERFCRYAARTTSFDNPLHCPHDLNHEVEFRDDLPVLLDEGKQEKSGSTNFTFRNHKEITCEFNAYSKPIVNVFENLTDSSPSHCDRLLSVAEKAVRSKPYCRYKLAKKFSESIEAQKLSVISKSKMLKKEDVDERDCKTALSLTSSEEKKVELIMETSEIRATDSKASSVSKSAVDNIVETNNNKRSSEQDVKTSSKKAKIENTSLFKNPFYESNLIKKKSHEFQKTKKIRNKHFGANNEKGFTSYNYDAVNFHQYKTFVIPAGKKTQKTIKSRRKGAKKSFKISI